MRTQKTLKPLAALCALALSVNAMAAEKPLFNWNNVSWTASSGLGYDSNAFHAPSAPYVDYAAGQILGANPLVVPKKQAGFFVPIEVIGVLSEARDADTRTVGNAKIKGNLYPLASTRSATDFTAKVNGGSEYVMARNGKSEETFYFGGVAGVHKQVYVDHDTGLAKTTTATGTDISNRYNYLDFGAEGKYKKKLGEIDLTYTGSYVMSLYADPIVVAPMDNTTAKAGVSAGFKLAEPSKLELSYDFKWQSYSQRHSRDAQGVYAVGNPLLQYAYNDFSALYRTHLSPAWQLFVDGRYRLRTDMNVGYNNYRNIRAGFRLLYEDGPVKGRFAFHHNATNYPNAFAFDVAGMGAKTYSGNDLSFKLKYAQTKTTELWSELSYKSQSTTDLRFQYSRAQLMAGMGWAL